MKYVIKSMMTEVYFYHYFSLELMVTFGDQGVIDYKAIVVTQL